MQIELITKQDLQVLRHQIAEDIQTLLSVKTQSQPAWLKSSEVRKMLKISPGTLQNLRISGELNPSKIGGSFYYRTDEIEKLLTRRA